MKQLILIFLLCIPNFCFAEEGGSYVAYIREVGNELFLSDFQLGSTERIKDQDGHGGAFGWIIKNEGVSFFTFEMGGSQTKYVGTVEDGVNVSFSPESGSGFEALSQSNNVKYDVDLSFSNPYVGLTYTNWEITKHSMRNRWFAPSTYGFGLVKQIARGEVQILGSDGTTLATAKYQSGNRRFFNLGWGFNYEFLYMSLLFRFVESPVLEVLSCNQTAIGQTACDRFEAATGNRNNATNLFQGGVLKIGILF